MDERISFNGVLLSKCIEKLIQLKSLSQPLKSRRSRVTMIAGGATESNVSGCLPAVSSIELRGCCTLGKGFGFSYSKPIGSLSPYVIFFQRNHNRFCSFATKWLFGALLRDLVLNGHALMVCFTG